MESEALRASSAGNPSPACVAGCAALRLAVDEELRTRLHMLATDFPHLWRDPNTPDRERKRLARLLLQAVTMIKKDQILVHIRIPGGLTRTLEVPVPLHPKLTPPSVVAEIDRRRLLGTGDQHAEHDRDGRQRS